MNRVTFCNLNLFLNIFSVFVSPELCFFCREHTYTCFPICRECLYNNFIQKMPKISLEHTLDQRCNVCGRPLISSKDYCVECANEPLFVFLDKAYPLFWYDGITQDLVSLWKSKGNRLLSKILAQLLSIFLYNLKDIHRFTLVPVPPRKNKIREKGWDQIEDIIHVLQKKYKFKVWKGLLRAESIQQKKLSKNERKTNLKGKICVSKIKVPEYIILIDDLMTTGATLEVCSEVLKQAGAKKVYGLCLFYD